MPFTSGNFSLFATGNPVVSGTTISSTWANNTFNDIASGLSTCVLKDGSQTITANLPMSGFKFTGMGAGSSNGDSLRYEQLFTGGGNLTLTGPLLFTADNTHDIGAAGATRARDLFLGRNALIGGTLGVTGATTLASVTGGVIAAQADQETATSLTTVVTPGRQQFHPSASKSWVLFDGAASVAASYNVTGVAKNSTGNYTVTVDVDFSSGNYAMVATALNSATPLLAFISSRTAGTVVIIVSTLGGIAADPDGVSLVCYGDQS